MKFLKVSLPIQILLSILLGLACGVFFGDLMEPLTPIGDAFIMLLKMSVLPYITCALIRGIGGLRRRQGRQLIKEGGLFLLIIWTITLGTLYALTLIFPFQDTAYYHQPSTPSQGGANTLLALFIPDNPFYALANNIVPAVVVFSVFFGVAIMPLKNKETLISFLDTLIAALTRITRWVVKLSPIGVFALIASAAGVLTVNELDKLQVYLYGFLAAALFFTFWALPLLVTSLTRLRYGELMRGTQAGVLLAFATGNIFVALPYLIEAIQQLSARPGVDREDSDNTVRTIVPIAYNLPLVGNLMAIFFILFLSFFYAIPLNFLDDLKLIFVSIFTLAGPVSAAINSVTFLVDALQLPSDGISLFAETMPLTRNLQGLAGAMGVVAFTLLTTFAHNKRLRIQWGKLIRYLLLSIVIISAVVVVIRHLDIRQPPPRAVFMELQIHTQVPSKILLEIPPEPPHDRSGPGTLFSKIRKSGILRVGYNPTPLPFCYFNEYGELVGYDIAYAYDLAKTLDCSIEFIPFTFSNLSNLLQNGIIDIAMSAITVTTSRLQEYSFSDPYVISTVVFVVPDHERQEFAQLSSIEAKRGLRLGVLRGSTYEALAKTAFLHATILLLDSYDTALQEGTVDALLWGEQEGTTWSLIHPQYTAVIPTPSLSKEYFAWALPPNSFDFLSYVNYWSALRRLDGFDEVEYNKWVKGIVREEKPRWSILRNVLH